MHRLFLLLAALVSAGFLTPAAQASVRHDGGAFAAPALGDETLAAVHGTGIADAGYVQRAGRDDFDAYSRQTGQILTVTFDNWFADVGAPLIIANQLRDLSPR